MTSSWQINKSTVCGLPALEVVGAFNCPVCELIAPVSDILSSGAKDIVLDLRKTIFFASDGLACLIVALKHIRSQGGNMYILGPTDDMRNVFHLTLLDKVLLIAKDESELLAFIGQSPG